jgi:hypothetical protein
MHARRRSWLLAAAATAALAGACGGGGDGPRVSDAGADRSPSDDVTPPGPEHRDAAAPPPACTVQAPTSCPAVAPRYDDVAPIISARCLGCHWGEPDGPWPLVDYPHVADWADAVRGDVQTCAMPPPDAGIAMPDSERTLILTWIRCGSPK